MTQEQSLDIYQADTLNLLIRIAKKYQTEAYPDSGKSASDYYSNSSPPLIPNPPPTRPFVLDLPRNYCVIYNHHYPDTAQKGTLILSTGEWLVLKDNSIIGHYNPGTELLYFIKDRSIYKTFTSLLRTTLRFFRTKILQNENTQLTYFEARQIIQKKIIEETCKSMYGIHPYDRVCEQLPYKVVTTANLLKNTNNKSKNNVE